MLTENTAGRLFFETLYTQIDLTKFKNILIL